MATALVALATTTLASSSATVTFSSISGSYRDLRLVCNMSVSPNAANDTKIVVNGQTSADYKRVYAFGDGSTASSGAPTRSAFWGGYVDGTPGVVINDFLDANATDKNKILLSRQNSTSLGVSMQAQQMIYTGAITSLTLSCESTTVFAAGSTFSLYGVTA